MIDIFLATPAFGGVVYSGYTDSVLRLQKHCISSKINISINFENNNSLIPHARNVLCKRFLDNERHSHILFVDADIMFNEIDVMKMFDFDNDVTGAIYARKRLNADAIRKAIINDPRISNEEIENIASDMMSFAMKSADVNLELPFEVDAIGAGLMLIKRDALNRMLAAKKNIGLRNEALYTFFDTSLDSSGMFVSEDFTFCNNWRALGGKIYAAGWVNSIHFGTFGFRGNLDMMLDRGLPLRGM